MAVSQRIAAKSTRCCTLQVVGSCSDSIYRADIYPDSRRKPRCRQFIQSRPDNFGIGLLSRWPLTEPQFVEFAGTELPNVATKIERDGRTFVEVEFVLP